MSNNHSQDALKAQKSKVSGASPKLKIIAPCTKGNGILKLKKVPVNRLEAGDVGYVVTNIKKK